MSDIDDRVDFTTGFSGVGNAPWYEPSPSAFQTGREAWDRQRYTEGREAAGVREAPLMTAEDQARIATGPQAQGRAAQMAALQQLKGPGPSNAGIQAQMQRDQGIQAAMANQAAGGFNRMGAAQGQVAQGAQAGIQSAAGTRAQEQAAREGAAQQLMAQGRGQDIGLATSQAGLEQQSALANQQAQMKQQEMNDKQVAYFEQMGFNSEQAQNAALQAQERMRFEQVQNQINAQAGILSAQEQKEAADSASKWGLLGTAASAAAIIAFSDERVKTNIAPSGDKVEDFLSSIDPYEYDYVNEEYGTKGKHYGIMAQDLERSEIGKSFVHDTPKGKVVDYGQGFNALLSGMAHLHKRLKEIDEED